MDKFEYVKRDCKIEIIDGQAVLFQRIRALRNIFREVVEYGEKKIYQVAKKGDLGAYIVKGALSQYDNAWAKPLFENGEIKKECFVGPDCKISENALVEGSLLLHDVTVEGSGEVTESEIRPNIEAIVSNNAVIDKDTHVFGDIFMDGDSRLSDSNVIGTLSMTDYSLIVDCDVFAQEESLQMNGKKRFWHSVVGVKKTESGSINIVSDREGKEK